MQIEIKTAQITQLRHTFSNVARRLGGDKPASRYQEATFDIQPDANFHYRPLWQPEFELYDKGRTAIRMADWYAFKDPRQYYYGAYTIARSRQQESMEKNLDFVEKRGLLTQLPEETREAIAFAFVPLRHVEWGANTNNCYITGYGWGTAITQATMFHSVDRLGIAQYLTRVGLILDGNSGSALARGKSQWLEHPAWQGLRRLVENTMVVNDWFELYVAQNFVFDGLLFPLVYRSVDAHFSARSGAGLSMITEFMSTWFDETARWVDATIKTAASESPHNAALLRDWTARWRAEVVQALGEYANAVLDGDAARALSEAQAAFDGRVAKLGLSN